MKNNSSLSKFLLQNMNLIHFDYFISRLHGSLTQQERSAIFKAFKEAKSGVLLTTVSTFSTFPIDFE